MTYLMQSEIIVNPGHYYIDEIDKEHFTQIIQSEKDPKEIVSFIKNKNIAKFISDIVGIDIRNNKFPKLMPKVNNFDTFIIITSNSEYNDIPIKEDVIVTDKNIRFLLCYYTKQCL